MTGGKEQKSASTVADSPDGASKQAIDSVWIFGYGSLLWKINFPYQDKVVGHVKGYSRKLWQGSTTHRGRPGAECTWGIAYKVDPKDVPEVMAYLDHREKNGYTTKKVTFYPSTEMMEPIQTLVYIGTDSNPMYLGPAPIEAMARQIVTAKGPSGCNIEYVLNLAKVMREIAPMIQDKHLFTLEGTIKTILTESAREVGGNCSCNFCGSTIGTES